MGFLSGSWVWGMVLAVALWGGYEKWRAIDAIATLKQEHQQADLDNANAAADRALEGNRRLNAKQGVIDEALKKRDAAAAAARDAHAVGLQLHDQVDALQAAAGARDPAAGGGCASAEARAGVFAELFRAADDHAEKLVGEAEGYRAAGEACERSYDSLERKPAVGRE